MIYSQEVEDAFIGGLILMPEYLIELSGMVNEEVVYSGLNKAIFKILLKLQNTNTPIDLIHVTTELKKNNASQNEIMRLGDIVSSASYSTDLSSLAKIMVEDHVKRQMMSVLDDLKQKLLKNEDDIGSLLFQLQNASNELEKNFDCMDSGLSSKEVAKITVEEIYLDVERAKKGQPAGINTGFSKLNMLSGGFKPNMFFILAARPSVGKTSVALHFLKTAAAQNKWVNMFSFEMDESEMFKILLASESDVNRTNIRDGKLDDTELRKINSAVGSMENWPVVWTSKRMNIRQLCSAARRNKRKGKCDVVMIDYIQLIDPSDKKNTREQQVSEISRELKALARELKVPVIALAQLSRAAETEIPQLRHLRESGSLEQDADSVVFIHREMEDQIELSYNLIVAKMRNGGVGMFDIWHNDQMNKFGDKETYMEEPVEALNYYEPNKGLNPSDSPF